MSNNVVAEVLVGSLGGYGQVQPQRCPASYAVLSELPPVYHLAV